MITVFENMESTTTFTTEIHYTSFPYGLKLTRLSTKMGPMSRPEITFIPVRKKATLAEREYKFHQTLRRRLFKLQPSGWLGPESSEVCLKRQERKAKIVPCKLFFAPNAGSSTPS